MDIAGAIAGVTAALGLVKELRDINAQLDQAELKLKIADLTTALSDAKLGLVDVAQSLRDKDTEIADLKKLVKYRAENLIDQQGFRYPNKDGKADGLPYCPACEAKGIFIRLAQDRNTPGHPFKCPSCRADYGYNGVVAR
ncbi:hypothetical protein ACN9MC_04870 [Ensifer adhaerens]|uniref:hypothetical protein n=1 Tax=Ensifer adhaerens TaxID=106592 RepID=UPI003CF03AE6